MVRSQDKIYSILLLSCLAGCAWLFYSLNFSGADQLSGVCIVKHLTGIPCPSCSSTRSVIALLHGNWEASLYYNPFGLIIAATLIISPVWTAYDVVLKKESLLNRYHQMETLLKQKAVYLPAIALVLANWTWNIWKYI